MSLVFAGITPHAPLLLPTIGKENFAALAKTVEAIKKLEQDLYVAQVETIIVISPHGDALPDSLSIDLNPKYTSNFEEFGDMVTKHEWKSDFMLINGIREYFKEKDLPLVLGSTDYLDYGTSVPLAYLTAHLPQVKVIPIVTSQLDAKKHFELGRELRLEIIRSSKRVALIASADLSAKAGENAPAGFSPRGAAFDEKIAELVSKNTPSGIMDIDDAWIADAATCGGRVLATFFGAMDDYGKSAEVLCYEKPFGVGYLTAQVKVG